MERKTIMEMNDAGYVLIDDTLAESLPQIIIKYNDQKQPVETVQPIEYVNELILYYNEIYAPSKLISSWVERKTSKSKNIAQETTKIFKMLYKANLSRMADALYNNYYNPIDNYSGKEELTKTVQSDGSDMKTSNVKDDVVDNVKHDKVDTRLLTDTTNTETQNKKNAFDSVNPILDNIETENGQIISNDKLTENLTENRTVGKTTSINDSGTTQSTVTETSTFTRAGNMGVTMTQQMQKEELEIRKITMINLICQYLDELLTIGTYK